MARTWERACSRARLGHVIRYIGRGRAAAKALRKPDARRLATTAQALTAVCGIRPWISAGPWRPIRALACPVWPVLLMLASADRRAGQLGLPEP